MKLAHEIERLRAALNTVCSAIEQTKFSPKAARDAVLDDVLSQVAYLRSATDAEEEN